MNIIFMGTPEFAIPSLRNLIFSNHKVVAVFAQKPKPKGRGMKIDYSPVHRLANDHNLQVYTPETLKNEEVIQLINSIKADIIVVTAYGFIIPKIILESKKYGCLNIHPSKLPKYRGAAPLQRVIIDGNRETAVCIMKMDVGLDTGDILTESDFSISEKITFQELHDKCAQLGADLLLKVLDNIDNIQSRPQSHEGIVYAHKLSKVESKINWEESAWTIDCKVRGMNPWPGVYFEHLNKKIKIIEAECLNFEHKYVPGSILNDRPKFFEIACRQGILRIIKLQPEGKKVMDSKAWQRGLSSMPVL